MASWTTPRTWATSEIVTAAQLNEQVRDNTLNLYDNSVRIVSKGTATSDKTVTATTEATASTIVSAVAFTPNGTSDYLIECTWPRVKGNSGNVTKGVLLRDATVLCQWLLGADPEQQGGTFRFIDAAPAAVSSTYTWKAFVSGDTTTVNGGAGGTGNFAPLLITVSKIT